MSQTFRCQQINSSILFYMLPKQQTASEGPPGKDSLHSLHS